MAFEDYFIARARVSSKPHKKISLDDKMAFFQQLSTLVGSGTPLLQALEICAAQNQSLKLRHILEQIASRVASGSSVYAAAANYVGVFQHHWIEVIRTGEVTGQMALVLVELNKQIADSRETRRKVMRGHDVSHRAGLHCRAGGDRHALAGHSDLRRHVQGHGRRIARHHPVRHRPVRFRGDVMGRTLWWP